MSNRKVADSTNERRATPASFSSPTALAEETLMEAQARLDRAAATFVNEIRSIRADLRATTAAISGQHAA